jgi:hypothetical protein
MSAVVEMLQFYPIQPDTEIWLHMCYPHPPEARIPFIITRMKPGISLTATYLMYF